MWTYQPIYRLSDNLSFDRAVGSWAVVHIIHIWQTYTYIFCCCMDKDGPDRNDIYLKEYFIYAIELMHTLFAPTNQPLWR